MKIYLCNICKSRGKRFSGIRRDVRKHLREEHLIRGKIKDATGQIKPSQLTANTIARELE